MKRRIPIFFASDDNYLPYLAVAIRSISDNGSDDNIYDVKVLTGGISEEGERALCSMKLPRVEIEAPDSIIAKNTVTNMQAGIVFGFAGLVEYIVKRIKKELGVPKVKTIATGGFSTIISKEIEGILCNSLHVLTPAIPISEWTQGSSFI